MISFYLGWQHWREHQGCRNIYNNGDNSDSDLLSHQG